LTLIMAVTGHHTNWHIIIIYDEIIIKTEMLDSSPNNAAHQTPPRSELHEKIYANVEIFTEKYENYV